ncbi:unnamed protein product [Rotaria socialis]|uniref:Gag-like protein n=1 Tax=Rotaria socialis TaxID=392032 RepID=A0A821RRH8_9BILA|nr:unnamed protein product [Rotaria socialis]CAF4844169.1 unnamed protein product [Rotaria socialis]
MPSSSPHLSSSVKDSRKLEGSNQRKKVTNKRKEDQEQNEADTNTTTTNSHQNQPNTDLIEKLSISPLKRNQQDQTIEVNGQLYAPVQRENPKSKKGSQQLNKSDWCSGPPMTWSDQHEKENINCKTTDTIPTPVNYCYLQESNISTPKRNIEQLNRSNEHRKKIRHDETAANNHQHHQNITTNDQGYKSLCTPNVQPSKTHALPFEQLKRAVGHNLPCFLIDFDSNIAFRQLPSAIIACDMIQEHFIKNKISINDFSVASFIGHRLKLGVNNMEDYSKLIRTEKWPSTINGKKVSIVKPKFVPECFTLVVRYVPRQVSIDLVTEEIKRSISSADNFKQIMYSFNRPTNDYRFTVADLTEFEGAFKFGRLCIANRFHPITQYLPANKLTFCTLCWKIGHTRLACNTQEQKCRICLDKFNQEHISICSGIPQCAQCGLNHQSLDPMCSIIQNYRQKLNYEVKQAVQGGRLIRRGVQRYHHQQPVPPLESTSQYDTNFPPLPNNNNNMSQINKPVNKGWSGSYSHLTTNAIPMESNTLINKIEKMHQELKKDISSLNESIIQKLDVKIELNSSNIQLHQVNLSQINSTMISLLKKVIVPLVKNIKELKVETKNQILTAIQVLKKPLNIQAEELRKKYKYQVESQQRNRLEPSSTTMVNEENNNQSPLSTSTEEPHKMDQSDTEGGIISN